MRNRKHFNENDEMTDINISPLIDMVFILLIFFIVTTVFVEEEGMATNTPDPSPQTDPPDEDKVRLTLLIKSNGEVFSKLGNVQKKHRPRRRSCPCSTGDAARGISDSRQCGKGLPDRHLRYST